MRMRRHFWDLLLPVISIINWIIHVPFGLSVCHLDHPCVIWIFVCPPSVCRWNQLDLAIVLLSIVGITLEEIEMNAALPINPTIIRIMRVLRIARGVSCTLGTFVLPALLLRFHRGMWNAQLRDQLGVP